MRTTLKIDDDLFKEAKIEAVRRGITLTALIEAGIRLEICRPQETRPFPTSSAEPAQGLDFTSISRLLEVIEGSHVDP